MEYVFLVLVIFSGYWAKITCLEIFDGQTDDLVLQCLEDFKSAKFRNVSVGKTNYRL